MPGAELETDLDVGLALDLLVGPLCYRAFVSREAVDETYVDALVDCVLRAVGSSG